MFLVMSQNSWAVLIEYDAGTIQSEVSTTFQGVPWSDARYGHESAEQVDLDNYPVGSTGTSGYALGEYRNVDNQIQLRLTTQVQSLTDYENGTDAFYSEAVVRSDGRLKFDLVRDPTLDGTINEESDGDTVRLEAMSSMSGSLNAFNFGEASLDFVLNVFETETSIAPVMTLIWDEKAEGVFQMIDLGNIAGKEDTDTDHFAIGESFYVDFYQGITTSSTGGVGSSGIASAMSGNDISASSITFAGYRSSASDTAPVPEPASFLLFGIGLLGFGLLDKIKKVKEREQ